MENEKLKVESYMKEYVSPEAEVAEAQISDVITTSLGTETPWYEESDGVWELNIVV